MRLLAVLLLSVLAAPVAGADDYIDLVQAAHAAAAPRGSTCSHPSYVEIEEDDADQAAHCCACAVCAPMVESSAFPPIGVPDDGLALVFSAVPVPDSSYRPEVYRPPSV